jgi:hypothetical protein
VFLVRVTPTDGGTATKRPDWALWRWDRDSGELARLTGCARDCSIVAIAPSPDGMYVAFLEGPPIPDDAPWAPDELVVIDATTGRSVQRLPANLSGPPAWDAPGNLIMTTAEVDMPTARHWRVDVESGQRMEVGHDLPNGSLYSSHDGREMMLVDHPAGEIYAVDPGLAHARQLVSLEDSSQLRGFTWAPDGTAFAVIVGDPDLGWKLQIRERATGSMIGRTQNVVIGDLLWLPAD